MIKSQLIARIAGHATFLSEKDIILGVNRIIEHMCKNLANGIRIEIRGFGSFSLHYRAPRRAHNPKTGDKVITETKYIPHFKPGKELRERVNAYFVNSRASGGSTQTQIKDNTTATPPTNPQTYREQAHPIERPKTSIPPREKGGQPPLTTALDDEDFDEDDDDLDYDIDIDDIEDDD